jgi:DNA helicase-2/ATP-dependent DNA helicase PcrA
MRERLIGLIGSELESKLIHGTFHSICRRYLVTYGYLIGIPKDFGIADSSDTLSILKRIIKRLNFNLDPKAARSRISHRKARGLRDGELRKTAQKNIEIREFLTVYDEYQRALSASNLLDYDDLLLRCTDLLRAHPQCVSKSMPSSLMNSRTRT